MPSAIISVLTPVRNRPAWLAETLDSLIAQTEPRWECFVLDDASTDATPEVAESYCRKDSRFRLIRLEKRRNIADVQNAARGLTQGEFIAIQDSDDLAMPDRFEKQAGFMARHPEIAAVGSWTEDIDNNGRPIGCLRTPIDETELKIIARFQDPLANPTAFMRSSALERIGWFDDTYALSFDSKLWCDFLRHGLRLANMPECLVRRRVHAAQNSLKNEAAPRWAKKAYASMLGEPLTGWEARSLESLKLYLAHALRSPCVVWGTGSCAREFQRLAHELKITIFCFIDSHPEVKEMGGIPVVPPEVLPDLDMPIAVASATAWHEIAARLGPQRHFCIHRIVGQILSLEKELGLGSSAQRRASAIESLRSRPGKVRAAHRAVDLFGAGESARLALALAQSAGTEIHEIYDTALAGADLNGRRIRHPDTLAQGVRERPVVMASSQGDEKLAGVVRLIESAGRTPVRLFDAFDVDDEILLSVAGLLPPLVRQRLYQSHPGGIWDDYGPRWYDEARFPADPEERRRFEAGVEQFLDYYADQVARLEVRSALEIGCGMGRHLKRIRSRAGLKSVAGIDPSIRMLKRSGERLVACADAVRLPFPDRTFELVFTAGGVLQHIPTAKRDAAVSELARVSSKYLLLWECRFEKEKDGLGLIYDCDWSAYMASRGFSVERIRTPAAVCPTPDDPERHHFLLVSIQPSAVSVQQMTGRVTE